MNELKSCPKCGAVSGDAWRQCEGSCPMPGSPHHKNHREPGEFGEGATVRRAEPDVAAKLLEMASVTTSGLYSRRATLTRAADEIERLREALRKIAAYDDAAANAYLRATGSYRCFDEPGAVEMARGVLEENK